MQRCYVIGDIHGGLKALKDLLFQLNLQPNDKLIFLGDYVDGWSDSAAVISYFIQLKETHNCRFIRGNHDDLVLKWLTTNFNNEKWLQHGGKSTKEAYEAIDETTKQLHIQFLENLEDYIVDEENRLFVHAGFANLHGPQHEFYSNIVYWDRSLWEMVLAMDPKLKPTDQRYPKRLKLFNEIYIGHTPTTRLNQTRPIKIANVINVDTGAAFKGPLTAYEINSGEVIQSKPVYQYYPKENGRN
ncbi:serine/threonine protein phosphatase 1 [Psychroflexus salarius]|uniref:Serine/threonine protein phosphatase 1 n=1 Tax=Psychroflexus salarius TaxID=1155689 RepID=A0A1M4VNB0_9FLAO|nr:metallophosphoesterase family protein [Psychroflexus salarius]SHE70516.1 serine/threonine protein phosphatase 1 [Psychroflexus salarius]